MKLTADQYYYVYFCTLEEPAMFKPLSYSSEFVIIRQPFVFSTDNASFKAKNIRAGSPDLFMSMKQTGILLKNDQIFAKKTQLKNKIIHIFARHPRKIRD